VGHVAACDITVRDRSGAGAAFLAGLLVALLDRQVPLPAHHTLPDPAARLDLGRLALDDVATVFAWANASGALATTRRGGLAALPGRNTVLRLIKGGRR
jgi:fructokinase